MLPVWDSWSSCNIVQVQRVSMPPVTSRRGKGHLRKLCRRGKQQGSGPKKTPLSQRVCQVEEEEDEDPPMLNIVSQHNCVLPPLKSGSRWITVLSLWRLIQLLACHWAETTFRRLWPSRSLNPTEVRLCRYSKQSIPV